jgi:hypothetical protein
MNDEMAFIPEIDRHFGVFVLGVIAIPGCG